MKARNTLYTEYMNMLNLVEDYYKSGYRGTHRSYTVKEVSPDTGTSGLEEINRKIYACKKCGLYSERKNPVPGEGSDNPLVLIIGEGPGKEEDKTGRPFVGRAGQYLDKWLDAVKLGEKTVLNRNTNVFIANIIKCRPPGNRDPKQDEIENCRPYLEKQIDILKPRVILTISRFAVQLLLNTTSGITRLRGKVYKYKDIPLVPTYHPSAVLRNPELRGPVWDDLKLLKSVLEKKM
jgi:DNA polymerase